MGLSFRGLTHSAIRDANNPMTKNDAASHLSNFLKTFRMVVSDAIFIDN
jgi:type IV secretory pathway TrbF-like protein